VLGGEVAEHLRGWHMVLGLTARLVSERAGITRATLHKIESRLRKGLSRARCMHYGVRGGVVPKPG
jgi:hypothetical protein